MCIQCLFHWLLLHFTQEAIFPGFPGGVAPLLPGKVEPLALLDLVTRLQEFSVRELNCGRLNYIIVYDLNVGF